MRFSRIHDFSPLNSSQPTEPCSTTVVPSPTNSARLSSAPTAVIPPMSSMHSRGRRTSRTSSTSTIRATPSWCSVRQSSRGETSGACWSGRWCLTHRPSSIWCRHSSAPHRRSASVPRVDRSIRRSERSRPPFVDLPPSSRRAGSSPSPGIAPRSTRDYRRSPCCKAVHWGSSCCRWSASATGSTSRISDRPNGSSRVSRPSGRGSTTVTCPSAVVPSGRRSVMDSTN